MKKKLGTLLLVVALALALVPAGSVSANPGGIVGLWHFDGNAQDSSGNNNHGTVYGAEFVDGKFGQALSFDGNDYVDCGAGIAITTAITVEAWIKPSAFTNYDAIAANFVWPTNPEGFSFRVMADGRLVWRAVLSGNNAYSITSTAALATGNWYHVAVTHDSSYTRLYINGTLDKEETPGGTIINLGKALKIGWDDYAADRVFNGLIDEVRIWDEALSAEDLGLDLFDVTVNAEGSALAVDIGWAYGEPYVSGGADTTGTQTTPFTLESILEGTGVTLTAPATHEENYTFYVFDYWNVDETGYTAGQNEITFDVTEDVTATAHYTKVISVDKTLERCYLPGPIETVTVDANDPSGTTSTATLESGKTYWFKASGTAEAGDTIEFDAKYSITKRIIGDTWTDSVSGYEGWGLTLLDLQIDSVSPDWGAFNPDHVYWSSQTGSGDPVAFTFRIYDIYYPNNSGSLTVEIYELCDCNAVPLGEEVYFDMTITVHAYEVVTDVYVEDGIGADLVVDSPKTDTPAGVTVWKAGKGKMGATKIGWTIGAPTPCVEETLDIVVHTGLNPRGKQEYTSTGEHELNSGPEVYFTYDGTVYMLQGPSVWVTVVE